jgi:hypothetical protein
MYNIHEHLDQLNVFIFYFQKLSSKYAFQRHQQWLQHAKTRSARHKIMKVMYYHFKIIFQHYQLIAVMILFLSSS